MTLPCAFSSVVARIPGSSGHRAYPLEYKALSPLVEGMTKCADWTAVPDHYSGRAVVATLRARVAAAFA